MDIYKNTQKLSKITIKANNFYYLQVNSKFIQISPTS